MKLVYLPLDSRPCNMRFPVQLLLSTGNACITPEMHDMDFFTTPSKNADIVAFLIKEVKDADVLILAVEQLVFGSLLASREDDISTEEALQRVQWIHTLKQINPRLAILAFSIIMRSSISTLKADDLTYHHAMTAYSQASHRARISGTIADQAEVTRIAAVVPQSLIDKYHRVRARNHSVNRDCIRLAGDGVIDRLILLQEDSQPFGFHRLEQAALQKDIEANGKQMQITMHNGTDEGGCLCAALAVAKPFKLCVVELGGGDCDFIAKYEDRPFRENIESQCRFAGITMTDAESADKILCVLTPGNMEQRDVQLPEMETEAEKERMKKLAKELVAWMHKGKPVGLLDVYYANGGAVSFMNELAAQVDPLSLHAYAAWNTASNALGTILSQMALQLDSKENHLFTVERLLDDLLYQSVVRGELVYDLLKQGEDPYDLVDKKVAQRKAQQLLDSTIAHSPIFARYNVAVSCKLPWPRLFEADITLQSIERKVEDGD